MPWNDYGAIMDYLRTQQDQQGYDPNYPLGPQAPAQPSPRPRPPTAPYEPPEATRTEEPVQEPEQPEQGAEPWQPYEPEPAPERPAQISDAVSVGSRPAGDSLKTPKEVILRMLREESMRATQQAQQQVAARPQGYGAPPPQPGPAGERGEPPGQPPAAKPPVGRMQLSPEEMEAQQRLKQGAKEEEERAPIMREVARREDVASTWRKDQYANPKKYKEQGTQEQFDRAKLALGRWAALKAQGQSHPFPTDIPNAALMRAAIASGVTLEEVHGWYDESQSATQEIKSIVNALKSDPNFNKLKDADLLRVATEIYRRNEMEQAAGKKAEATEEAVRLKDELSLNRQKAFADYTQKLKLEFHEVTRAEDMDDAKAKALADFAKMAIRFRQQKELIQTREDLDIAEREEDSIEKEIESEAKKREKELEGKEKKAKEELDRHIKLVDVDIDDADSTITRLERKIDRLTSQMKDTFGKDRPALQAKIDALDDDLETVGREKTELKAQRRRLIETGQVPEKPPVEAPPAAAEPGLNLNQMASVSDEERLRPQRMKEVDATIADLEPILNNPNDPTFEWAEKLNNLTTQWRAGKITWEQYKTALKPLAK